MPGFRPNGRLIYPIPAPAPRWNLGQMKQGTVGPGSGRRPFRLRRSCSDRMGCNAAATGPVTIRSSPRAGEFTEERDAGLSDGMGQCPRGRATPFAVTDAATGARWAASALLHDIGAGARLHQLLGVPHRPAGAAAPLATRSGTLTFWALGVSGFRGWSCT